MRHRYYDSDDDSDDDDDYNDDYLGGDVHKDDDDDNYDGHFREDSGLENYSFKSASHYCLPGRHLCQQI